jgi:hypothetical protein
MTIKEEKLNQEKAIVVSKNKKKVRQPNLISTYIKNKPLRTNIKREDINDSISKKIKRK